jgi:hypothetical protein
MENKHGGKRTGAGRKPIPDSEKVVKETVYIQPGLLDKFRALGKSKWLNMMIRKAKL